MDVPDACVDCVVTSPPYAELKDYGAAGQLGFGQPSTNAYLGDLSAVLSELHRACKAGAALWIVLDTVKTSGKTLILPWEVISRAQGVGWNFEDLVIWDKGRSLPWSHVGRFRGVFEYVLLFSKGGLRHFAINKIREIDHLSPYWVRFPERYNPQGKAPSDLWHFPIPLQGSWSKNGIRHHCPFPIGMVARMITLTSRPGDLVLDPFAGTGTVLAVAHHLGRRSIGIDLNSTFVRQFHSAGFRVLVETARSELGNASSRHSRTKLSALIVKLRMLKLPLALFSQLSRPDRLGERARRDVAALVLTPVTKARGSADHHLAAVKVGLLARSGADLRRLTEEGEGAIGIPPLSKYGLQVDFEVVAERRWTQRSFWAKWPHKTWFTYRAGRFYSSSARVAGSRTSKVIRSIVTSDRSRFPPLLASLTVQIRVPASEHRSKR